MISTNNVNCVHQSPVNYPFVSKYPSPIVVFWWVPFGLMNVVSRNIANDLATSDLFETMIRTPMIVLWLMNLFEIIGHVFDPWGLHNRSRLSHCRWMGYNVRSRLSLVVHKTRVCVQLESLRDQIFDTNFAIFDVLYASSRDLAFQCAWSEHLLEPSVLLRLE